MDRLAAMTTESPKTKPKRVSKAQTLEEVCDELWAKVQAKGAAGHSPITAKTAEPKRSLLITALERLAATGQIWIDRSTANPKAFLAEFGPSAARTADKIEQLTAAQHPVLLSLTVIARKLSKADKPTLSEAMQRLLDARRLIALISGKSTVYAHAETLRGMLGILSGSPPPDQLTSSAATSIRSAYREILRTTGFPDVEIATLQENACIEMPTLKTWLRAEHQAGRAHFSIGDWSLASEAVRSGAVDLHDVRYLQVRLEDEL